MAATAATQAQRQGIPTVVWAIVGLELIILRILYFPVSLATVAIKASSLFTLSTPIGPWPITNAYITSLISLIILALLVGIGGRAPKLIPSGLRNFAEWAIGSLLSESRHERGRATIWVKTVEGQVPLFRSSSADLNFTLALALTTMSMAHVSSIRHTGWGGWISKFINLRGGAIGIVVGLLETLTRIIDTAGELRWSGRYGEIRHSSELRTHDVPPPATDRANSQADCARGRFRLSLGQPISADAR